MPIYLPAKTRVTYGDNMNRIMPTHYNEVDRSKVFWAMAGRRIYANDANQNVNIGPCGRDPRVIEVLASLVQTRGRDHAVLDL